MIKDNWIKAYREKFRGETLSDYGDEVTFDENQEMYQEMIDFISQVEKDAIEKTNKRWREELKKDILDSIEKAYWSGIDGGGDDYAGEYFLPEDYLTDRLSDLLEDK